MGSEMCIRDRYVFEFRNKDCYTGQIADTLGEIGAGLCIHDFPGRESPLWVTSEIVYLRFHGYRQRYGGDYPDEVLEQWAKKIIRWSQDGQDVFAYFNNDAEGNAVKNAVSLRNMIENSM